MVSSSVAPSRVGIPSAAVDFWSRNAKGGAPLLPDDIRDRVIQNGETVLVLAVRDGETRFGPTWFCDIEVNGQRWTTAQAHNQVRDALMLGMREYIAEYGPLPASMTEFETKEGNWGWDFGPPYADAARPAVAAGADDEVPF